jgi:hypothetical protein
VADHWVKILGHQNKNLPIIQVRTGVAQPSITKTLLDRGCSRKPRFRTSLCLVGTSVIDLAAPEGIEPSTSDLEGPCSIQLSYGAAIGVLRQSPISCKGKCHEN